MKAAGRQLRIRELLESQEFIDLATLCRELDASESSVRRDLIAIEKQGLLRRVYGGAMASTLRNHDLDFDWQSTRMAEEKRRIGALAATLIEDGQTVILGGGSTVAGVARALKNHSLQAITNSLPIAELFNDSREIEVTLTGGYLYPRLRLMVGPLCEQMLAGITADVLVMGIGGVTEAGFSNSNSLVVSHERKMIEVARKVIIVADHTKFGHASMLQLAPLEAADVVVSDAALAPEHQGLLKAHGVETLLA
ncbi:MAG TPA: DeoR/GlpR family DNA-binding transcription regulator [Bryobacteraceae bacterium]|nr:DeoR/GlpR family DNA-binding transcription regulator [Bryobacteraceae bacterium]